MEMSFVEAEHALANLRQLETNFAKICNHSSPNSQLQVAGCSSHLKCSDVFNANNRECMHIVYVYLIRLWKFKMHRALFSVGHLESI